MKKIRLLYILLFTSFFAFAQKTIPASGGEANGQGKVSYTVGQVISGTYRNATASVSQGIQQSLEIFVLSNPDFKELALSVATYPNPTQDNLILDIKSTDLLGLSFSVYDIKGRELLKGIVKNKKTTISVKNYAAGVYLLKVNQKNKELKTFKIIKK